MKRFVSALLIGIFTLSISGPALAAEKPNKSTTELAPNTKSAILIEMNTGSVIYEKNKDEQLSPASMTKIMTMLLIMEALDKKQITMDEKVRTSEYAASMGGSQIFLEPALITNFYSMVAISFVVFHCRCSTFERDCGILLQLFS